MLAISCSYKPSYGLGSTSKTLREKCTTTTSIFCTHDISEKHFGVNQFQFPTTHVKYMKAEAVVRDGDGTVKDKGGKESNSTENEGAQRGVRVDEHIFRRWSEKFDLQKKMIFTCISFYYR
jgi:hypothetical protein